MLLLPQGTVLDRWHCLLFGTCRSFPSKRLTNSKAYVVNEKRISPVRGVLSCAFLLKHNVHGDRAGQC